MYVSFWLQLLEFHFTPSQIARECPEAADYGA